MLTREIEKLLTPAEVCEILRCSRRTLYNLTHYYKTRPPVLYPVMVRSKILFRPSALDDYLRRMDLDPRKC
jgi:excisionase family DNA binding protein